MTKFIIALLAISPDSFIDYAQNNFLDISDRYILQIEQSKPHITLAQFYGEESDIDMISQHFDQGKYKAIFEPRFISMSFKKDKMEAQIWWAEISVARDPSILSLQKEVEAVLVKRDRQLINASGELFNPHLTLARIEGDNLNLNLNTVPLQGEFKLAIGKADQYGQFVELVKVF